MESGGASNKAATDDSLDGGTCCLVLGVLLTFERWQNTRPQKSFSKGVLTPLNLAPRKPYIDEAWFAPFKGFTLRRASLG